MNQRTQSKRRSLRLLGIAASAALAATPAIRNQTCATMHAVSLKMEATPYHMYFVDSAKGVEAEMSAVDTDMWISKSRGLVLKANTVMDAGTGEKSHSSARYDYSNVKPPAGVR